MNSTELKQKIVYDLIEARQHFSEANAGPILCVLKRTCREKVCSTLEEARSFYPKDFAPRRPGDQIPSDYDHDIYAGIY